MNLPEIHARIDAALVSNKRAETIVIYMTVAIFVLGVISFLLSYAVKNLYVASGSMLMTGFLYWPIRELLKLRRENVYLQVFPVMAAELDRSNLAKELKNLLDHLRGAKSK